MFKISNIEIKALSADVGVLTTHLRNRIESLFSLGASEPTERVVQVSIRLPYVDPLEWLVSQQTVARTFWKSRDGSFASAGSGVALQVAGEENFFYSTGRERIQEILDESEDTIRIYGGLRFNPTGERGEEWASFKSYNFILPRYELQSDRHSSRFVINLLMPADRNREDEILSGIDQAIESAINPPCTDARLAIDSLKTLGREDMPSPAGWTKNVEWSLSAFSRSRLGKVVLARKAIFSLNKTPDAAAVLLRLKDETPNCFHFLFQAGKSDAFVGASPERLISVSDRKVASEAVAGTRPRSEDKADDESLRDELLHSEKDQREHQFVRTSIKDTLSSYCDVLHVDNEASEMMLSRGRHLVSHIEGVLQRSTDIIDVIKDLHPTSAVGGYPTVDAMEVIEGLEPFDRGWYAGPIGWIGKRRAEFAVAIRSGLISPNTFTLYSGAGIVGGSDPVAEWNEIEQKLQDFVQVFELEA